MPLFSLPAGLPPLPTGYIGLFTFEPIIRFFDDPSVQNVSAPPVWGLFPHNADQMLANDALIPWITGDTATVHPARNANVAEFSFKRDWIIADYPLEGGDFESYDKVRLPFEARLRITKGGTTDELNQFLIQLDNAATSMSLYDVVTADCQYPGVNITHYDYRQTAERGANLLVVDVWLQEIRQVSEGQFSSTGSSTATLGQPVFDSASPSGADPQNGGPVPTQAPTTQQQSLSQAPSAFT